MSASEMLLSPKDLAAAIGASESSLRRWIDHGDIRVARTAGGHRRIPLSEAVQFIRRTGAVVVRPDVLNLPAAPPPVPTAEGLTTPGEPAPTDEQRLFAALHDGRGDLARALVVSWYLQGRALHSLFDGPVRGAMHRLGELWEHDPRGILVEHRATDICLGIITGLRALSPPAPVSAPLAVGGAPPGDPYQIPSMMAAAVAAEAGLRDVNFGPGTPLDLLAAEAVRAGARVAWVSVSAAPDPKSLRAAIRSLASALAAHRIDLVVGGSAAGGVVPKTTPEVHAANSMGELAAFCRGLLGRDAPPGGS